MTCGILVPIDRETLRVLGEVIDEAEAEPAEVGDDPHFPETVYQMALVTGTMDRVKFR